MGLIGAILKSNLITKSIELHEKKQWEIRRRDLLTEMELSLVELFKMEAM